MLSGRFLYRIILCAKAHYCKIFVLCSEMHVTRREIVPNLGAYAMNVGR